MSYDEQDKEEVRLALAGIVDDEIRLEEREVARSERTSGMELGICITEDVDE
jgi:hypothetical protein